MLRGLTRLFRFRLRMKNARLDSRHGVVTLVADWQIIDRKTGQFRDHVSGATRHEARKALRWYRRFGQE